MFEGSPGLSCAFILPVAVVGVVRYSTIREFSLEAFLFYSFYSTLVLSFFLLGWRMGWLGKLADADALMYDM
ncbi:hypothetical protein HOY82DRAFT_558252, partial [Tuber indicum]